MVILIKKKETGNLDRVEVELNHVTADTSGLQLGNTDSEIFVELSLDEGKSVFAVVADNKELVKELL